MNARLLLRSGAVCLGMCALGVVLLVFFSGRGAKESRGGIHIGIVSSAEAARERSARPIVPGAPSFPELSGPEFRGYQKVAFPGANGSYRYLAWRLACSRAYPDAKRAEDVHLMLFSAPRTPEEARERTRRAPKPIAVLTAKRAEGEGLFEPDRHRKSGAEAEILLSGGVRIDSVADGRKARLTANDLTCWPASQRVRSRGPIRITADEYTVRGVGFSGNITVRTFTVEKDVVVTLPTSALGAPAAGGERTTIRSGGQLLVERLGGRPREDGRGPTRVTLDGGVTAQDVRPGPGEPEILRSLKAEHVELRLLVHAPGNSPEAKRTTHRSPNPVAQVDRVIARGDVHMADGKATTVTAVALELNRVKDGDRIVLTGPAVFHHQGRLRTIGPEPKTPAAPGSLDVSATELVTIRSTDLGEQGASGLIADFSGAVHATQTTGEGVVLLDIRSDVLHLDSTPARGQSLTAFGGVVLTLEGVKGNAKRLLYRRGPATAGVGIRLEGSPVVRIDTGAGANSLGLEVGEHRTRKGGRKAAPAPVIILESEGPIVLVTRKKLKTFGMDRKAVVREIVGGQKVLEVKADDVNADFEGKTLSFLDATGHVHASGKGRAIGTDRVVADAEQFSWSAKTGVAHLAGHPASLTIAEAPPNENVIEASLLSFEPAKGRIEANGQVSADVFLPEEDDQVCPAHLDCDRLVAFVEKRKAGKALAADPAGRIRSLTAKRDVDLSAAGEWRAYGQDLQYSRGTRRTIVLSGSPAQVARKELVNGREYHDRFHSASFTLTLRGKKLVEFHSDTGGSFELYRAWRGEGPSLLGTRKVETNKLAIEKIAGQSHGLLSFSEKKREARMTGGARIEQWVGPPRRLKSVASFDARIFLAHFGLGKRKQLVLESAEGREQVKGRGQSWQLTAEGFSVDFVHHQTTVWGAPAVIRRGEDPPRRVARAIFDTEHGSWEFLRLSQGK